MTNVVSTIYETTEMAERAVNDLVASGFDRDDILLMVPGVVGSTWVESTPETGQVTASAGVVGALLGGAVGIVAGAVPGGLLLAGPVAGLFAGAGVGAVSGTLVGALAEIGIPEENAIIIAQQLENGQLLVGVRVSGPDEAERARGVLDRHELVEASKSRPVAAVAGPLAAVGPWPLAEERGEHHA